MDKVEKIKQITKAVKIGLHNNNIQEEIDWVKERIEYLEGEIEEESKDEDPIIEAFQKSKFEEKIGLLKKALSLYEKALKSIGKERTNLIREAMLIDLKESQIDPFYDKRYEEIKEEFEIFKKKFK